MSEVAANAGIVGTHVEESLSPVMHNAAYQALGVDLRYGVFPRPQPPESQHQTQFDAFLDEIDRDGTVGLSVTKPFKVAAAESSRVTISETVRIIGAANTLIRLADGGWHAENTDWLGAIRALDEAHVDIRDTVALVIGASGTARAVAFGLARQGAEKIVVVNRTPEHARSVVEDFQPRFPMTLFAAWGLDQFGEQPDDAAEADIVFNASSVGQDDTAAAGQSPLSESVVDQLKPTAVVSDAVYMPIETPLLTLAAKRGLRWIDGTRMLLHQAVEQVEAFTGSVDKRDGLVSVMDQALRAEMMRRATC